MRAIRLVSLSLITLVLVLSSLHANAGNFGSSFNRKLDIAYGYPNQLHAAMHWRLRNTQVNLRSNRRLLNDFGWHPSVVAVISHPSFFNFAYAQPGFSQYRDHRFVSSQQWNPNQWGNNNRRFNQRGFNRGFNNRRNRRYCR